MKIYALNNLYTVSHFPCQDDSHWPHNLTSLLWFLPVHSSSHWWFLYMIQKKSALDLLTCYRYGSIHNSHLGWSAIFWLLSWSLNHPTGQYQPAPWWPQQDALETCQPRPREEKGLKGLRGVHGALSRWYCFCTFWSPTVGTAL
jgi:hypothetical protein